MGESITEPRILPLSERDPQKIALFDLDGTVADLDAAMRRDLAKIRSPVEPEIPAHRDEDDPPWLEERKFLIRSQPGWWRSLARFQLGWDVYEMTERIGFMPHVLTKGPRRAKWAWTEKLEWCDANFPPGVPVTITMDKSLVYGRVLTDDWPPYIEAWLAHRPRGIVVMPAQPWNADYKHERVIRYDGTNAREVMVWLQKAFDR